ncbi:restriction endonuclease subunit S [Algoriphagus halophilus]|uniref:restriction endonuclease subunit S n=1 Tax=Algoriphagus halophilus TaxID=226505 RepID=UPI00358F80C0
MSKIKLGKFIEEISMGPFGSDIKVENFINEGMPVLNGSNLTSHKLVEDGFKYVSEEKGNSFGKAIARRGDIVITHRGTLGQVAYIPYDSKFEKYVISQSQFRVRFKKEIDPIYFSYLMKSKYGQAKLLSFKNHVGVPALAQATTNFKALELDIHDIGAQQKIASFLSALDDKIELNNRINAELEAMAKLIYEYWFVQFDFPDKDGKPYKSSGGKMVWNKELKREIPEGWEVKELGELLDVNRGISYRSSEIGSDGIPMINLNSFNLDGTFKSDGTKYFSGKYQDKNLILEGDLLIAITDVTRNADIIGKAILVPNYFKELVFSMDVAKVIPNEKLTKTYLMMLFNTDHYHNYIKWFASGTIVLHLNLDGMKWYKTEIPPANLLNKFESFYKTIANRINETTVQNQELASLRDWLLPMLMNGQVTVADAEEIVKEKLGMVAEERGVISIKKDKDGKRTYFEIKFLFYYSKKI